MAVHHIFAYGSLLNPASLLRSLPDADPASAMPARLHGYRRSFTVAFPNNGSQTDKAYFDDDGRRPAFVLFADVEPTSRAAGPSVDGSLRVGGSGPVNGVVLTVGAAQLDLLIERERRYSLIDVSNAITAWPGLTQPTGRVAAFVGHPRYTAADDVARGVVSSKYLATINTGVAHWDSRHPGFADGFRSSTVLPPATQIASLRRVDAPRRPADGLNPLHAHPPPARIHRKGWL